VEQRILVVESVAADWHVIGSILLTHRYRPLWAVDCRQAIEDAKEHRPKAVLVDLDAGKGDGFAVLERFRMIHSLATIPLIAIAGTHPDVTERQARDYGAAALIRKPVSPSRLIDVLQQVLKDNASAL